MKTYEELAKVAYDANVASMKAHDALAEARKAVRVAKTAAELALTNLWISAKAMETEKNRVA